MEDSGMGVVGDILLALNKGRIFLRDKIRSHMMGYRVALLCTMAVAAYCSDIVFLLIMCSILWGLPGLFVRYVIFGGQISVKNEIPFMQLLIVSDALVYVWKGFRRFDHTNSA